jgi:GT2 family glycosyltransferase
VLDIIVVNYKTPSDLDAFLGSLEDHPSMYSSTLTIVEVEAPEAYTHTYRWGDSTGTTIAVSENIGYGRACNLAAERGRGEIIALFNADVMVHEGTLDTCVEELVEHPDWAVVGPRQVDTRHRLVHAGIFGTLARPVHRGWMEADQGQYRDTLPAVTVSGSAYFVRRSVSEQLTECPLYRDVAPDALGAFLPTSHYYEETWCSYHAQAHGHQVMYLGTTSLTHKWHRASPVGGWAEQQMPISQELFRKACSHHGIPHD